MYRSLGIAMVLAASLSLNQAQSSGQSAVATGASPTIAAKRPVFAGACKACPWGILGIVTTDALKYYGYDVQMCWTCATSIGPRQVADKIKPVPRGNVASRIPPGEFPAYLTEPPPDAVPDFGATSEVNLINAWNGTGDYAKDNKQRRNYRVIAVVRTTTYLLAAASKKSGITNLSQIKDRAAPTWIERGNDTEIIFDYYGIKEEDLKAKGGGVIRSIVGGSREHRATADVFIGSGLMAATPEQGWWNEASQLNDLVFMDFEEPLLAKLAEQIGWQRASVPLNRNASKPFYLYSRRRPGRFCLCGCQSAG